MEEYFSAAAQSVAGLSYGGTRLWREYLNVISVDKRLNLLRKFQGMSSQNCPKTNERLEPCLTSVVSCWRIPIFPGRLQPSIFGTTELNFCVRNGNRWTLCVNLTNFLLHLHFLQLATVTEAISCSLDAPSGIRTRDPLIKSQLLYQLS